MSIEIEVGLENATRMKPRTEELRLDEAPAVPQTNTKLRNRLVFGGAAAEHRNRIRTKDSRNS